MKIYRLYTETIIDQPLERVFNFFKQPENLNMITPKDLGFVILTLSPVPMREGQLIDYKIRLLGLPLRWTSKITLYQPPNYFVDEQLRGPYAYWKHTHEFKALGDKTWMSDEVLYAIPMGILGQMAQALYVKKNLERIFSYREKVIKDIFRK